jgi:hypothetical protein
MAVDAVVSRELKSLQEELSASQRERLAAPAATSSATAAAGEPVGPTAGRVIHLRGIGTALPRVLRFARRFDVTEECIGDAFAGHNATPFSPAVCDWACEVPVRTGTIQI